MMTEEYDQTTYGDRVAGVYDDWHPSAPAEMINSLKELAGDGPVLELGIGSGRVALPLAAQGIQVHGIDASPAMVAQLRTKPGGDAIPVTIGNFGEVGVDERFSLIFVVFNTLFLLLSQEEQVQCFANVRKRLLPQGLFLVEAFVPDMTRFTRNQAVVATQVGVDRLKLDVSSHDPVSQRTISQHVLIAEGGIKLYPVRVRYAWPSELDLMARLAEMRLQSRWSDWKGSAFNAASTQHISIYELA